MKQQFHGPTKLENITKTVKESKLPALTVIMPLNQHSLTLILGFLPHKHLPAISVQSHISQLPAKKHA